MCDRPWPHWLEGHCDRINWLEAPDSQRDGSKADWVGDCPDLTSDYPAISLGPAQLEAVYWVFGIITYNLSASVTLYESGIMLRLTIVLLTSSFALAQRVDAATIVIEPDNYVEGAVLNDVSSLVQLRIYDSVVGDPFPTDFGTFPHPGIIPVTSTENEDIFGGYFTSTGTKAFGHSNITFFTEGRELAMRFLAPTSQVSIDFIGTNVISAQIGVLEVYSSAGTLLNTFTSAPRLAHEISTLTLTRATGDIGYARAYSSPDGSPFGALDNLRFETVVQIPGDYNDDQIVNAADYTVWRNSLGLAGPNLPADGTGALGVPDGVVNRLDYDYWKAHYGEPMGSGSALAQDSPPGESVPEPNTWLLLLLAIGWVLSVTNGRSNFSP